MPAVRKPTNLLQASGALAHDPKRYADRVNEPQPSKPLGTAPKHLTTDQKKTWKELASTAPERVLANTDRWIVELACVLMAKLRSGNFTTADIGHLRSCLASLGMTPADRSRVSAAPDQTKPDDPLSILLN